MFANYVKIKHSLSTRSLILMNLFFLGKNYLKVLVFSKGGKNENKISN